MLTKKAQKMKYVRIRGWKNQTAKDSPGKISDTIVNRMFILLKKIF